MTTLSKKMENYVLRYKEFEEVVVPRLKQKIIYKRERMIIKNEGRYFWLFSFKNVRQKDFKLISTKEGTKVLREFRLCDALKDEIKIKYRIFAISTIAKVESDYDMYKEIYVDTNTTIYVMTKFGIFEIERLFMRDESDENINNMEFFMALAKYKEVSVLPSDKSKFYSDFNNFLNKEIKEKEEELELFDTGEELSISFHDTDYNKTADFKYTLSTVYIDGEKFFDVPDEYFKNVRVRMNFLGRDQIFNFYTWISYNDFKYCESNYNSIYNLRLFQANFRINRDEGIKLWTPNKFESDLGVITAEFRERIGGFFYSREELEELSYIRNHLIKKASENKEYDLKELSNESGTYYIYSLDWRKALDEKYEVVEHSNKMYKYGYGYINNTVAFVKRKDPKGKVLPIVIKSYLEEVTTSLYYGGQSRINLKLPIFILEYENVKVGNLNVGIKDNHTMGIMRVVEGAIDKIKDIPISFSVTSNEVHTTKKIMEAILEHKGVFGISTLNLKPYKDTCAYHSISNVKAVLGKNVIFDGVIDSVQNEKVLKLGNDDIFVKNYTDYEETITLKKYELLKYDLTYIIEEDVFSKISEYFDF